MSIPAKVLIVDDEPRFCDSLVKIVAAGGYRTTVFHSGQEALSALSAQNAAVVLLDIGLPDMNGLSVLDAIRSRFPEMIVVVMTGYASMASALEAIRKGAFDYLKKPFEPDMLLRTIQKALQFKEVENARQHAEEALRRSEEKYRLLVEHANDAIFVVRDGRICFANPSTLHISGYTQHEIYGLKLQDLIHPKDRDWVIRRHLDRLEGSDVPASYAFRLLTREKKQVWLHLDAVKITWEERPATINFARNITREKHLEMQFHQAQKMEAIGTLAGGIAHDFNNLLMGMQGCISLLKMRIPPKDPNQARLESLIGLVASGADLTRQLLGFSRGGYFEVKPTNVREILKKTAKLFSRTRKDIRMHETYAQGLWTTEIDRGQIEQVLLNILVNAGHAMAAGGDIFLSAENITLTDDFVGAFDRPPGRYVLISIRDTGTGMDDEVKQRAFEPFFTTKPMGRGTGLGLASAYGIVKNHKGIIDLFSEKGWGTIFRIFLPASPRPVVSDQATPPAVVNGKETLLMVDDEAVILEAGGQLLEALGYRVFLSSSGREALNILRDHRDEIQLVILDMIMPEMDGEAVLSQLKQINPQIKVLLASGYGLEGRVADIVSRCDGFIQKPFDFGLLSVKVRELFRAN
jgi:two-component system cell cycle sensor histidine kinase/response regulator CckA